MNANRCYISSGQRDVAAHSTCVGLLQAWPESGGGTSVYSPLAGIQSHGHVEQGRLGNVVNDTNRKNRTWIWESNL